MVRLVYAATTEPLDGIRSYTENCREALETHEGLSAKVEFWSPSDEVAPSEGGDVVVLQYNPFSYGRRGVAPWLVRKLRTLRRTTRGSLSVVLQVHEAYVPSRSIRWALMSGWQRVQLAALGRLCDRVVISTEAWHDPVRRLIPHLPIDHVAVGSNLPDERHRRSDVRAARGWDDDSVVIGTFGADPSARIGTYVRAAIERATEVRAGTVLCLLGADPLDAGDLRSVGSTHRPGIQPADQVASDLGALDLFLAPFEDGVSARRTTLAAALQHELAVVGTRGRNTDSYLANDTRLTLVDVDDSRCV